MAADTVDSHLPLSLLEAVRSIDTPEGVDEAEYVPELRNKRLGLSDTVYAQIRRFSEAARKEQRTRQDEAAALARLIGRRPDAEAVFRAAGRRLADAGYATIPGPTRTAMRVLPAILARPIALRHLRRIADRFFNGSLSRVGAYLLLQVPTSVTLDSAPRPIGCTFYEAGLRELIRLLVNGDGAVEHVRCTGRDEGTCEWRAEWRGGAR